MSRALSQAVAIFAAASLAGTTTVLANPQGGSVVAGTATIAGEGTAQVTVTQSTDRAIINWDSFSIGVGERTEFVQPGAHAIAANRVIGLDPSEILGTLQANGQVVLINRNGILFGQGARVDAAGLIATTHDLDNAAFMAGGQLRFDRSGQPGASVVNRGRITISDAGMAGLVAPHVRNSGIIVADLGRVALGAAEGFTLDLYGDGLISFAAGDEIAATLTDAEGTPLQALVQNDGEIAAEGGRVLLTASAAREVVNQSVNLSGIVRAASISQAGGVITLTGSGQVAVETSATVEAGQIAVEAGSFTSDGDITARDADGSGGTITIAADAAGLGGTVSASGTTGGSISVETAGLLSLAEQVEARGTAGAGGSIRYDAGRIMETTTGSTDASGASDGGSISVTADGQIATSGSYRASGATGAGGRIDMTAGDLRLLSADLVARGQSQGGLVRLGGAFQGGKTPDTSQAYHESFVTRWANTPVLANADQTFVNDATAIDVSATAGAGGTAVIWSDRRTTFLGAVDATGAAGTTAGGSIEISSAEDLRRAALANVDVGAGGHLLLDPKNIVIGTASEVSSWAYAGILGAGYVGSGDNIDLSALEFDDRFGTAVSLNAAGDRLAVGAETDDGANNAATESGAVYLFTFTDTSFSGGTLVATIGDGYSGGNNVDLSTLDNDDRFGSAVSLNAAGDRLAVGAVRDDGPSGATGNAGAAYLFTFTDTSFSGGTLAATIGDGYSGGKNVDVSALEADDRFGTGVSLNAAGDRLAVSAEKDDGPSNASTDSGAAYLFAFTDTSFSGGALVATIGDGYSGTNDVNVSTLSASDFFGQSVSLNAAGDRLAVGATGDDGSGGGSTNSGAAYLFTFTDTSFSGGSLAAIIGDGYSSGNNVDVSNLEAGDTFGRSVSLNAAGDRLAVSAILDGGSGNSTAGSGAVYLFTFTDTSFSSGTLAATVGDGYTGGNNIDLSALAPDDFSGRSVSLNAAGDRLAVGTYFDDGSGDGTTNVGAVYLFTFADTSFSGGTLEATLGKGYSGGNNLDVTVLAGSDHFGRAVSLNAAGNRMAVGTYGDDGSDNLTTWVGAVHLFSFSDTNFSGASLEATIGKGYTGGKNVDVSTLDANDLFGYSVALNGDGNRLAVGAIYDDGSGVSASNAGAVYLFTFSDTTFTGGALAATLGKGYSGTNDVDVSPVDAGDNFGYGVSLNAAGNRLAVGSVLDDASDGLTNDAGAAYLFTFSDTNFTGGALAATLGKGYSGTNDVNVSTLRAGDYFGQSVSLNAAGNRLAVSASSDDGSGDALSGSGAVHLFTFTDTSFGGGTLAGTVGSGYTTGTSVNVSELESHDAFGTSVSLNAAGDRLAVGAWFDDGESNKKGSSGAVYLFTFTDMNFSGGALQAIIGSGYVGGNNVNLTPLDWSDYFGSSVSLNAAGDRLAVGSYFDDGSNNGTTAAGAVYLFTDIGPLSTGTAYGNNASETVQIAPADIAGLLDDGTAVTLQASNDITVSEAVTVTGTPASIGALTLQAGRSILVNANITTTAGSASGAVSLFANDLLANGVVDGLRDAGAAAITMASGTAINAGTAAVSLELRAGTGKTNAASGDITLDDITGGTISAINSGPTAGSGIVLNAGAVLTASATSGTSIELAGDGFTNNAGAGALATSGTGRFLVWSSDPSANTRGGITHEFKQYNATRGVTAVSGGAAEDGFLYSIAPTLTPSLTGSVAKTYDATTTATLASGNYSVSGAIDGDTVTLNNPSSGSYDNKNVGSGKTVTATGISVASATNGAVTVFGYQMAATSANAAIGSITAASLTVTGVSAADKTYDATTTASLSGGSLSGVISGDTVTLDGGSANGTFADENVGTAKAVTASGYALSGTDAGNYVLTQPTGLTADITAASLTITGVSAADKVYDAITLASLSGGSLSGVISGDTVTLNSGSASGAFADKNVGTAKAVTASGYAISGADAGNYSLTQPTGLTADITALTLTVTGVSAADKVYDATTTASLSGGSLSGVLGGDTVTLNSGSASGAFADKNVGTAKAVTASGYALSGADAGNYSLTQPTGLTADITAATVTASLSGTVSKVYDGNTDATLTAGNYALRSVQGADAVALNNPTAGTYDSAEIGTGKTVTVTGLALTGADAGNYLLAATTANAAIGSITAAGSDLTARSRENNPILRILPPLADIRVNLAQARAVPTAQVVQAGGKAYWTAQATAAGGQRFARVTPSVKVDGSEETFALGLASGSSGQRDDRREPGATAGESDDVYYLGLGSEACTGGSSANAGALQYLLGGAAATPAC